MSDAQRILLLEDDPNLGLILQEHLTMQGYEVTLATDGEQGLELFDDRVYCLCLVDVMMPKRDGFSFVEEVRKTDRKTPMIFLTAKSLKEDKIKGFRLGCDDYITKPFSMEELMLRIGAVLKRCGLRDASAPPAVFALGPYRFDYDRQLLVGNSREIHLTPKESDLLRLLCMFRNETVPREEALRQVWGNESYFSGRSMDVFVSKLRKHFKNDPEIEIIGVHGKGFRLVVSSD